MPDREGHKLRETHNGDDSGVSNEGKNHKLAIKKRWRSNGESDKHRDDKHRKDHPLVCR
jgi:hypothetical protein